MPKLFRHKTKASELNHNDLANIGPSDHHTKYTDAEAVAAAKADDDIADAITKKHTQNTDTHAGAQDQDLNMNTHKVVNVTDPTANQDAATKKYVDDKGYVDRGNPTAWDFTTSDFITDAAWHDLDLSSIVPVGTKAVHLFVELKDDAAESYIYFRKNGNTSSINRALPTTQAANVLVGYDIIVACDSNRIIEYYGKAVTFSEIYVIVKGWFI